ncbi:MAG: hypothetical protein J6W93_01725 [Clostridia bacterium]|jgi:hypothetical protein|nr:hypothetical protein [Clostridia bacterium]MBP5238061.1 hypothetical protein [Clostridia bacterium]MBP5657026.1 hypothetical protein [Clostridia bacterium]MBP5754542.1 hypothetical protein [Clostridia bacterium]
MDYRDMAKDLLVHRNEYITAREALENEIEMLSAEKYSISSYYTCDPETAPGGSSRYENYVVNLITLIDDAKFRKQMVERKLKQISAGLSVLDDYQRDLIDAYFIYRIKTPCEQMMKKHDKDEYQIRVDKLAALEKFTRGVYGVVQT